MELKDTIELMQSADYKDRFKAEYQQLKIRTDKLEKFVDNYDNLDFTPDCTKHILKKQYDIMTSYLNILEERASIEKIELV